MSGDARDVFAEIARAMTPIGTLVYDERVFPIIQVRLAGGRMRFVALVRDEVTLEPDGEIRVHGEDGSLIFTTLSHLSGPAHCPPGELMQFEVAGVDPAWPPAYN